MTPLRAELHELVDELPEQQVTAVIIDLKKRVPIPHTGYEHPATSLRETHANLAGSLNGVYPSDYQSTARGDFSQPAIGDRTPGALKGKIFMAEGWDRFTQQDYEDWYAN